MKILVTGGAGYLGSIMVGTLLARGDKVIVVDSFVHGVPSLAHFVAHPNFDVVRGDVRDVHTMRALFAQADVVIPLAAVVGAPACAQDPLAALSTNVEAVRTMVGLLSPQQRVIIPITNSGYGVGEPGKECTEETPMRPISLYGRSKVEAEKIVMGRENSISLRLATVFGMSSRMRLDLLVNDFVYRAVRDKSVTLFEAHFKRNYIHVRDVARAFVHAIDKFDAMRGEAFNVGLSHANLSKLELCQMIKEVLPDFVFTESAVGADPDKRDYIVSNAKIEETEFMPRHSLSSGIAELVRGYRMVRNERYGNV